MPGGLPSLRWSVEPKRRRIVKVTGVKKASRLSGLSVICVAAYSRVNQWQV